MNFWKKQVTKLPKGKLTCARNTYYALFHTICALNIEYNLPAPNTHRGVLSKLYHKFIKTGILTEEDNKVCVRAEEIRVNPTMMENISHQSKS